MDELIRIISSDRDIVWAVISLRMKDGREWWGAAKQTPGGFPPYTHTGYVNGSVLVPVDFVATPNEAVAALRKAEARQILIDGEPVDRIAVFDLDGNQARGSRLFAHAERVRDRFLAVRKLAEWLGLLPLWNWERRRLMRDRWT